MSDELVGCICSSLAGLMGAVRDAVTTANGLGSPTDVLPAGGDAAGAGAAGAGGDGGEHQGTGGLSPTHIASILLIILAVFLSTFRSKFFDAMHIGVADTVEMPLYQLCAFVAAALFVLGSPALPAKAPREPRAPHREDDAEPPVA